MNETLSTKQRHLIGIGAAVAVGCEPCTASLVAAAREAGACERGVRFCIERGLAGRASATAEITAFADRTFARPELDTAFREERALIDALIGVAAAVASNAAPTLEGRIDTARTLGATDEQLRVAAQLGRITRRSAENEAEAEFSALVGAASDGASTRTRPC